jgi:hypothetical protein
MTAKTAGPSTFGQSMAPTATRPGSVANSTPVEDLLVNVVASVITSAGASVLAALRRLGERDARRIIGSALGSALAELGVEADRQTWSLDVFDERLQDTGVARDLLRSAINERGDKSMAPGQSLGAGLDPLLPITIELTV